MSVPLVHPRHRPSRMRGVLLVFLLIAGPVITFLGHITNNSLDVSLALDVIVYIVAIVSEAVFEEIRAQGLSHAQRLFIKVPEVFKWVFKQLLKPTIAYAILIVALLTFLAHSFLVTPETHAFACVQTPLRLLCGDGIGPMQVTIDSKGQLAKDGSLINIGIVDEHASCSQNTYQRTYIPFDQFDATNGTEKDLVNRILKENCEQADTHEHFTLILATTLSRTVVDNGFSISVGLEELRGAFLAQQDYNRKHTVKLRLLVANLGTKDSAQVTAPLVAAQIALYSKNSSSDDHFIGAVGFPFSITAQQALPILQQNNVQIVASSPSSDQLSKQPGFYRIEPPDNQQIAAIHSFISDILHPKKVMVLYDQRSPDNGGDPYSNSLGHNVIQSLSNDVNTIPVPYNVGQPDTLEQQLPTILNARPDLLFFAGYPDDLNALKEMLKRKQQPGRNFLKNTRIMGAQAFYELGGYTNSNYEDLLFTTFAFPDVRNQNAKVDFQKEYQDTFDPNNEHPGEYGYQRAGPHSALSYDAVTTFTSAVERTSVGNNVPSTEKIKNELINFSSQGATGWTTFNGQSAQKPSDPTNKLLYLVCTNKDGLTREVAEYENNMLNKKAPIDICA